MELYKTVRKQAEAVQVIDKSRFIAHVFPVESREEADAFLAEIREKYKDATHNVPAMVRGDKSQIQWASDDGEPQGTSGAPMVQMMVKEVLPSPGHCRHLQLPGPAWHCLYMLLQDLLYRV